MKQTACDVATAHRRRNAQHSADGKRKSDSAGDFYQADIRSDKLQELQNLPPSCVQPRNDWVCGDARSNQFLPNSLLLKSNVLNIAFKLLQTDDKIDIVLHVAVLRSQIRVTAPG